MVNVNKLSFDPADSVVDFIIYSETSEYQQKNYHNRYFLALEKVVKPVMASKKDIKILDAPCGSGIGTQYIEEQTGLKPVGIDLCSEAIDFAKTNYSCDFHKMDILDALNQYEVDCLICMEFLEHVPMDIAVEVVKRAAEKINKGGKAIFSSPRRRPRESTGKRPGHINEFSEQEFYYLLEEHFPMVERFSMDRYANIVNYTSDSNLMIGVCSSWEETRVFI
jgi:2-polyprenyl-3-methyl-5-hydroxy-6-metoxy-1,4-benzoquinol methylase